MTERDRLFWQKVTRRTSTMTPEMEADVLRAFRIIRESLSDIELAKLIASGLIDEIIDQALLDRAFIPLRNRLLDAIRRGFDATIADVPRAGKIQGTIAIQFDTLNPRVLDAIRELDTRVLAALKDDVRDVVRAHIENGLRDGRAPKSVAREIRAMIGLGPSQLEQVENFRDALAGVNNRRVTDYKLRNKTVDRLLAKGPLTEEQIDRYVDLYTKRRIAQNAETVSRTATLDSYRLGQHLSWKDARDKGVIPPNAVMKKQWIQIDRPTKRPEHELLHGEIVDFDAPYSNGSIIPGDQGEYGCGCLSRVFIEKAAEAA